MFLLWSYNLRTLVNRSQANGSGGDDALLKTYSFSVEKRLIACKESTLVDFFVLISIGTNQLSGPETTEPTKRCRAIKTSSGQNLFSSGDEVRCGHNSDLDAV